MRLALDLLTMLPMHARLRLSFFRALECRLEEGQQCSVGISKRGKLYNCGLGVQAETRYQRGGTDE